VAVPLLVGLGVDELSVSAPAVARVKRRVRALSVSEAEKAARSALDATSADDVRDLARRRFESD
jgi:phosphoenolpyruvate-protein kinase (PTS system EI component)